MNGSSTHPSASRAFPWARLTQNSSARRVRPELVAALPRLSQHLLRQLPAAALPLELITQPDEVVGVQRVQRGLGPGVRGRITEREPGH